MFQIRINELSLFSAIKTVNKCSSIYLRVSQQKQLSNFNFSKTKTKILSCLTALILMIFCCKDFFVFQHHQRPKRKIKYQPRTLFRRKDFSPSQKVTSKGQAATFHLHRTLLNDSHNNQFQEVAVKKTKIVIQKVNFYFPIAPSLLQAELFLLPPLLINLQSSSYYLTENQWEKGTSNSSNVCSPKKEEL